MSTADAIEVKILHFFFSHSEKASHGGLTSGLECFNEDIVIKSTQSSANSQQTSHFNQGARNNRNPKFVKSFKVL